MVLDAMNAVHPGVGAGTSACGGSHVLSWGSTAIWWNLEITKRTQPFTAIWGTCPFRPPQASSLDAVFRSERLS